MTANSTGRPNLAFLFETFDFQLGCSLCSLRENEITYTPKSVKHHCIRELLLARVKGIGIWRPISRRPLFPNPGHYEVCRFFTEGSGCSKHRRRCTFARSHEEAAVWNVEKKHGFERSAFIAFITTSECEAVQNHTVQPDTFSSLAELSLALDLKTVCTVCSVKENEITYMVKTVNHQCSRDMLLAKVCGNSKWRPISHRPGSKQPGRNCRYQVCMFFVEGSGCTKDQEKCTFARSHEEATVWNFEKDQSFPRNTLLTVVSESETEVEQQGKTAENILNDHSGEFLELCKDCFHDSPPKITVKRWNSTCSADKAHTWSPVLVHHFSESGGKEVYNQVRPLPLNCGFEFCGHVQQGMPCWHGHTQCQSAHSEVEMAVWKAEDRGKLIRQDLLQLSQSRLPGPRPHMEIYCKVCLLVLSSQESFFNHCASLEHAQLISEDTTTEWKSRPPPPGTRADFWLCDRPDTCEYGNNCLKAHSVEELEEWMMRSKEEREIRNNIETQGFLSFNDRLLEEYRCSSSEVHIMSEQVDDVSITCDKDLYIEHEQITAKLEWNFQVKTERQLAQVALLKQEPGALFSLGEISPEPCIYSKGQKFHNMDIVYDITVSFKSINPGLYEQWLVLDFDMRPVLLQKLKVKVGPKLFTNLVKEPKFLGPPAESFERWHRGNKFIVPCQTKTEVQEDLLKEYKPHQISFQSKQQIDSQTTLNHQNYKDKMHAFLYNEERAKDQVVSRLNFRGAITLSATLENPQFGMKIAPQGELFCAISVPYTLTPDTSQGFILKRYVQSALIAPVSSVNPNSKAYEAVILHDAISKDNMTDTTSTTSDTAWTPHLNYKMHLQLSKRCCSDLRLQSNAKCEMEVQFQLNRLPFCKMHEAIDQLPDTKAVLPDFSNCAVPVYGANLPDHLNAKQSQAIQYITGNLDVRKPVAPLLIYGPFGTGKTFTLAEAARKLAGQPQNKVLICTHTNSSADLYVKSHFHEHVNSNHPEARPLRIKSEEASLNSTDEITLNYCHLSQDKTLFCFPDKDTVDMYKVVITTTSMARHFHKLTLPPGYFTHILIDEASQMLECEALMPLGLAGPNTRLVLAGDHMQMGPKLFSVDDHQRSNHTLLNRLFHFYQQQKGDAAFKSRIIFSENYRSTKEIVDFVSTHFYVGKTDVIKAVGNVPSHPSGQALKFHHVRGECILDTMSMSWYNQEEVVTVVDIVKHLTNDWPSTWGQCDASSICVLSEGCQVHLIREALRKINLRQVKVENITNVQGKEFRAIVMTTVQTRDSLQASDSPCLEMFNDACVLNTAMTRAQSQVFVVGDAAALCYFGKCSRVWKSYIDYCSNKNSVVPNHVTKDFIDSDIKEISRLLKTEALEQNHFNSATLDTGDSTEDNTDAVFQQMMEEYNKHEECSSDGSELEPMTGQKRPYHFTNHVEDNLLELCKSQPNNYKQGRLIMEKCNTGYIVPSDNPNDHIYIKGRNNLGKSFSGDEVVIEKSHSTDDPSWKVKGTIEKAESPKVFVCKFEDEDYHRPKRKSESQFLTKMLIPLCRKAPKICILVDKKCRNSIPIWSLIDGRLTPFKKVTLDEELKQNNVFLVEVLCWKEHCFFPLGNVIEILPIGQTLDEGLNILDREYNNAQTRGAFYEKQSWEDDQSIPRQDFRKITTFTVDNNTSTDLDDAISVRYISEDYYEVGVHIADVAQWVKPDDELDNYAKSCGATRWHHGKRPDKMLPPSLCSLLSLRPGYDRKVISLMMKVKKGTEKIVSRKFQLCLINSNEQLSYDEAEQIIAKRYGEELEFSTVEDCVAIAYRFSKAQRKVRLQKDWNYAQSDCKRKPGKRRSWQMIEELMVLFSKYVSELLIANGVTQSCTPLRCQAPPDPKKVRDLQEKHKDLLPLSHIRHAIVNDDQLSDTGSFYVLTSVWNDILLAANGREADVDKIVDLVAADDIYPQLLPVILEFRECNRKVYTIRSNSCFKAIVGHYSLKLSSYTHATAPIRRYMDIILQRLLHTVIRGTPLQYSKKEIDILCQLNEEKNQIVDEYDRMADMISFAANLKEQNASKIAFVAGIHPGEDFKLSFPFDNHIFPGSLPIKYRDLQLEDQPVYDSKEKCMTLKWRRRLYSITTTKIHLEVKKQHNCSPCTELSQSTWKDIIGAIDKEDWDMAKKHILSASTRQVGEVKSLSKREVLMDLAGNESSVATDEEHYVDLEVQLKTGDTVQVQITSEKNSGYCTPTVQLLCIKPKFEICVNHAQNPITCFSKRANSPSTACYSGTNDYVEVWRPICEMESAACAVGESNSIIIEDLVLNFSCIQEKKLTGSFDLPLQYIKTWAIECNLGRCFLCIRKRGIELTSMLEHSDELDPSTFTWVAHGETCIVEEPRKNSPNPVKKVDFHVTHWPMKTTPKCVIKNHTTFTVELIPKLLPDIRKENAVNNIVSANDLVQRIACGIHIPKEAVAYVIPLWRIMKNEAPPGLPKLNRIQSIAVEKALNNNFTLIQGPPGTGKTVVGAYIVYWFLKCNAQVPRMCYDAKGKEKREVILYCGPSNKSVDVVAEYLFKFGDKMKPLRVYSQQVEMLEYPYPGSVLQLSVKSLRQEQSKPELRPITLHHRIREEQNPFSSRIRDFDERTRHTKEFTDEEVEDYKKLLREAREYELKRHDVILCTCTAASTPTLTNTVSARQILIDECAMATEPQSLVPLVCNKPEKIVLLGDHKQLRPIVKDAHARKLGLSKSLFERYIKVFKTQSVMLETQYRMHEDICRFPSEEYYDGKLITQVDCPNSVLLVDGKPKHIVFGDIQGKEISLVVATGKGNENSKANIEEKDEVVRIAKLLVERSKVEPQSIVILSPYNAQVAEIKEELRKIGMSKIDVTTITKSQGSEWRYVLLSTVRSLPSKEIEKDPERSWLSQCLGFVGDPNQINVGITRAKEGLCIIGNQALLNCSGAWRQLLGHYNHHNAVSKAEKISVRMIEKKPLLP